MTFRLLAIGLAIVLTGDVALAAEDAATLEQLVQMNRKALEQLQAGQKDAARDSLLEAVVTGKGAGLGTHQVMARTYVHLGAVYLTGFGDREKARKQFENAVRIRPSIQLTPAVATPAVQELFEAARKDVGAAGSALVGPGEPGVAPEAAPEVGRSSSRGRGRSRSARARARAAQRLAAQRGDSDAAVEAAVNAALDEPADGGADPDRTFWVSLGIGSGFGFHPARELENRTGYEAPAGIAFAAVAHLAPEFGYRYSDKLAFSLQTRHQLVPRGGDVPEGPDNRPRFAHAFFARVHYYLRDLNEKLELWATGNLGVGSAIRLYIPAHASMDWSASDTVAAGPVALGPGAVVIYHLAPRMDLLGELRALATLNRFALVFDLTVGASFSF